MVDKLSLRIRIFLFFAALAGGVLIAIGAGFFAAMRRVTDPDVINVLVIQDFISGFLGLGIIAWVWFLFDIHVAKAIEGLAGAIRARAHADVDGEIDRDHARYLGDLAPAASAAVMTLAETRNALAESVARETTRIANDKLKLEALLSDVPLAVLLCTGRHHLAFYNGVAQEVLDAGKAHLGLDRNLFDFLRDGPVRQAHARLMKTDSPDAATEFICTTQTGNRRLAARMRLVGEGTPEAPCYVLTLRDVTAELALHGRQEALLNEVFERVRPPVAALQTARTALNGEAGAVETLVPALESLTGTIDELGERFEATRTDGWPLAPVRSEDLAARLARRLSARGLTSEQVADPLTLRCNAFDVVALMEHLGRRVDAALGGAALSVAVRRDAPGASLHLGWQGAAVGEGDLASWLEEPLDEGDSSL
ncbi:MAG: hypothetical protein KDI98_07790, partial [Hyphomicrobiaceae bacterium]|nr:hypothetical protein [Hyphomicrobiaceae bacterium]